MGIEPTSRRANDDATALKTAVEMTQTSESKALTPAPESDFTKNDTKDPDTKICTDVRIGEILRLIKRLSKTERARVLGFVEGLATG